MSATDQAKSQELVFETILKAIEQGRSVVPFVAAGLSAASGFPLTAELRQYLAKVAFFIRHGIYQHALGQPLEKELDLFSLSQLRDNPSRYLKEFGWPDLNQLDADLWNHCNAVESSMPPDDSIRPRLYWIDLIVDRVHECDTLPPAPAQPVTQRPYRSGRGESRTGRGDNRTGRPPDRYKARYRRATARAAETGATYGPHERLWGCSRWRLQTAAQQVLIDYCLVRDERATNEALDQLWNLGFVPRVNWFDLILELTEGDLGLLDALFLQLGLHRKPAAGHILMAYLAREIGLRLCLTTNFDTLLETAYRAEGLSPIVFDVTRDSPAPDPAVVKQSMSIIKLHGSAFGIRAGERLDYSLDDDTRDNILRCIDPQALLLVLGFSGGERRMMQLIEHLTLIDTKSEKKIIWLHHEDEESLSPQVKRLEQQLALQKRPSMTLIRARIADSRDFLFDLCQRLFFVLPKTQLPYGALPKRVLRLPEKPFSFKSHPLFAGSQSEAPVRLFYHAAILGQTEKAGQKPRNEASSPSMHMSEFIRTLTDYHVIWIDLEDHHTVAGVVTELVDQMRVFDPTLPGLQLPTDDASLNVDTVWGRPGRKVSYAKASRFIQRALRRGRYALAFDSLEGFGRAHTSHHGLSLSNIQQAKPRVECLLQFLRELTCINSLQDQASSSTAPFEALDLDWYCCIACDEPTPRHLATTSALVARLADVRQILAEFVRAFRQVSAADDPGQSHRWSSYFAAVECPIKEFLADQEIGTGESALAQLSNSAIEFVAQLNRSYRSADAQGNNAAYDHQKLLCDAINSVSARAHGALSPKDEVLFLACCLFRRPRTFAGLAAVCRGYMPASQVETFRDCLDRLQKFLEKAEQDRVVLPMSGGLYWIPHYLHQATYKALTEPIRSGHLLGMEKSQFCADLRPDSPAGAVLKLQRLIFLTSTHSRISRFYYLHAYLRSKDSYALFEYLYHRVSALRYLKLAAHLVSRYADSDPEALTRLCSEADGRIVPAIRNLLEAEGEEIEGEESLEVESEEDVWKIVARLLRLRRKLLMALSNVLHRELDTILSTASADTWLAWIAQLLDDLSEIVPARGRQSRHAGSREATVDWSEETLASKLGDDASRAIDDCRRIQDDITSFLQNTQGMLLREKRSWAHCIESRLEWLRELALRAAPVVRGGTPTGNELPPVDLCAQIKQKFVALKTALLARPLDDQTILRATEEVIGTFAEGVERADVDSGPLSEFLKSINDRRSELPNPLATVRSVVANCVAAMRDILACMRHLAATADDSRPDGPGSKIGAVIAKYGKDLLERLKDVLQPLRGNAGIDLHIRGITVEMEADLLRYRIEDIERRLKWRRLALSFKGTLPQVQVMDEKLKAKVDEILREGSILGRQARGLNMRPDEDTDKRQAQIRLLLGRGQVLKGDFETAEYWYRQAENGLKNDCREHRGLLALLHELRAQGLIWRAQRELQRGMGKGGKGHETASQFEERLEKSFKSSEGCLKAARQHMVAAESLLRTGRRAIGQWRRWYDVKAELSVNELIVGLVGMQVYALRWRSLEAAISWVHSRAIDGLEAIRGGFDCSIYSQTASDGNRQAEDVPWLVAELRIFVERWIEIQVATYFALANSVESVGEIPLTIISPVSVERRTSSLQAAMHEAELLRKRDQEVTDSLLGVQAFNFRWHALNKTAGLVRLPSLPEDNTEMNNTEMICEEFKSNVHRSARSGGSRVPARDHEYLYMHERAAVTMEKVLNKRLGTMVRGLLQSVAPLADASGENGELIELNPKRKPAVPR